MNFILYPANTNKLLEPNNISKYINIKNKSKTEIITYDINKNININKDVIIVYGKPDILIINFDNN